MLRRQVTRARRVARGLLRADTRAGYLEALRHGGHRPARYSAVSRVASDAADPCAICGGGPVILVKVHDRTHPDRVMTVRICQACGHTANPDNTFDYRAYRSADHMTMGARIGTEDRRGREFHMAKMAEEILDRPDLDALIFGAGRSLDNHHIGGLPRIRSVTIADIMQVRDDAPFIRADEPAPRRYDIVVACEVVEHFLDPHADFPHLFGFVEDEGLLVCSTNIMDGSDITKQAYPFYRGHVSLYSPRSLGMVARENGYLLDFRLPLVSTGYAGRHKRYLLLSKSPTVMGRVAEYFGDHAYAPSDAP